MVSQALEALLLFYGFLTALLVFMAVSGYWGVKRGYQTMSAFGASTTTYRVFGWLADRWKPLAGVGGLFFLVGASLALAAGSGHGFVIWGFVGAMGYIAALLGLTSIILSRAVEAAREEVEAGSKPPVEARSPWVQIAVHYAIWFGVFGLFWYDGLLGSWPWLWALFVLGLVQIPIQAWKSAEISRWLSQRIDDLFGFDR